jgi:Ca2+-binding EF-hand superfamily protein
VVHIFRLIVDKIDKDADGFVSGEELKDWIQYTQKRYIIDDVERHWKAHNPENKEKLSWEEYKKMVYGFMDGKKTIITDDKIISADQPWQFGVDVQHFGECSVSIIRN